MSHERRQVRPRSSSAPPTSPPKAGTSEPAQRARRSSFGAEADNTNVPKVPGSYRAIWHPPAVPPAVSTPEAAPSPPSVATPEAVPNLPAVASSEEPPSFPEKKAQVVDDDTNYMPTKSTDAKALYAGLVRHEERKIDENRFSILRNHSAAVIKAHNILSQASPGNRVLALFGDCSAIPNAAHTVPMAGAYAVSHPDQYGNYSSWGGDGRDPSTISTWKIEKTVESTNGELLAVLEALNIAKYLRTTGPPWSNTRNRLNIHIFTDSQRALKHIKKGQDLNGFDDLEASLAQPIVVKIISLFHELESPELFCRVDFHWIPGHGHDVHPHVTADKCAKKVAKGLDQPLMAGALRGSGGDRYMGRYGGYYVPPYHPIGRALQKQVLEIALRHPALDQNGSGPSENGKKIAAERAASMAPDRPWLEEFSAGKDQSLMDSVKKILSSGLTILTNFTSCGNETAAPEENTLPPPRPITKRKERDFAADGGYNQPSAAKRAKRQHTRSSNTNTPTASYSFPSSAQPRYSKPASTQTSKVPPEIAELMARRSQFRKPF